MPSASNCRKHKVNNTPENTNRRLKVELKRVTKKLAKLLKRGEQYLPGGIKKNQGRDAKLSSYISYLKSRTS